MPQAKSNKRMAASAAKGGLLWKMIEYVFFFALVDKRNLQSEVKKMLGKELEDIYHDAYQIKFAYEQGIREGSVVGNSSMRAILK